MAEDKKIGYVDFCDLHSLREEDRYVIAKKFGDYILNISEWYEILGDNFDIDKNKFAVQKKKELASKQITETK